MQINISLDLVGTIVLIVVAQSLFYASLQYNSAAAASGQNIKSATQQFWLSAVGLAISWVMVIRLLGVSDPKVMVAAAGICLAQLIIMYTDKQFIEKQTPLPQISLANSDMSVWLFIVALLYFAYKLSAEFAYFNVAVAMGLLISTLIFARHQRMMGISDGFSYVLITTLWCLLLATKNR
jgi:hypothetical protein